MFGPLNVFRSLPEASSTHSATAQQSPQGSSMKGLCAVVGIGTTAVLHSVLITTKTKSKAKYELMSSTFLEVNLSKDDHDENVNMRKVVTNCRLLRPAKYS